MEYSVVTKLVKHLQRKKILLELGFYYSLNYFLRSFVPIDLNRNA